MYGSFSLSMRRRITNQMTKEINAKAAMQASAMPTLAPVERDLLGLEEDEGALEVKEGVAEAMAKVEVEVGDESVEG